LVAEVVGFRYFRKCVAAVSSPVIPAPHGNQIHADVTTVTSFD
jgi:hypothetical protein